MTAFRRFAIPSDFHPLVTVNFGEEHVPRRLHVNFRHVNLVRKRKEVTVNCRTPNYGNTIFAFNKLKSFLNRTGDFDVGLPPSAIREHNVTTARQTPGKALKRLPPHDHRGSHGNALKMAQVFWKVPGQLPILANDAVVGAGNDYLDGWSLQTATSALMWGWGS